MKKIVLSTIVLLTAICMLFSCTTEEPPDLSVLEEYDFFVDYSNAGSSEIQEETASNEAEFSYILNTNTKKFHLPDCSWVGLMGEKNKSYRFETKEELIKKGYSPCYHCCLNN